MKRRNSDSGRARTIVVIALAIFGVVILLTAAAIGVSYFAFQKDESNSALGETIAERINRADRSIRGSTTDPAKITSVAFEKWDHLGPLYPGPNDPPGYVQTTSIEFRSDLTAVRNIKKDYDRDLPDDVTRFVAPITAEQFASLAQACAANDIVNEPDSTETRTEGAAKLVIEYAGEMRSIVTSNIGRNTDEAARVLQAITKLENSLRWTPTQGK